MIKTCFLAIFIFIVKFIPAQEKSPVKFGKISAEDFKKTNYQIDSSASAIVLADIGNSQIVGNRKGSFSLEFRHFKRFHILKKSGYDVAEVKIPLYTNGQQEEELQNLKAYTYNLENGKIVETKLEVKSSVFKDKINKNQVVKKFTFPAVKEGSIIEFEYTVLSDFLFNLRPWDFQGSYPRLWSEYKVALPEFLYYVLLSQGLQYNFTKEQQTVARDFEGANTKGTGSTSNFSFKANVTDYRFVMKNIPALKEENFTSTLDNHISKIEFQLSEIRDPLEYKKIMGSWFEVCKNLLNDEDFGLQLSKDNSWMNEDFSNATKGKTTSLDKAKALFSFLQMNFTCTSYNGKYISQALKNTFKEKKGNVAEINLLLVIMLRKAGINSDPVILSTKTNGYTYAIYPIMDRFNYVICRTVIDGKTYYLDASRPQMGFGHLSWNCYNGHARIVNESATAIELSSDSLFENKITSIIIVNAENGKLSGSIQQTPGYYESYSLREKIKEKGLEELIKEVQRDFVTDVIISNAQIDSLNKLDESIQLAYDIEFNVDNDDLIYLNPMFGEAQKENPFKSAERSYPVEMPYALEEMYVLRLDVPKGFQVDELPKSVRVNFDEKGKTFFEYIIESKNGVISLRSIIKLNRSYYQPDEYETLRNFFALIVNKHSEMIVFKKKTTP